MMFFKYWKYSVGIPEYYKWRSPSGYYVCFFQRQDEWLGLKNNHPELFKLKKLGNLNSANGLNTIVKKVISQLAVMDIPGVLTAQ